VLSLWRFSDGKPGHDNQSLGLTEALAEQTPTTIHTLDVHPGGNAGPQWLSHWLWRRYPPGALLPAPDLLLGAGHATHGPMLAAQRAYGGRTLVLMRPSLPRRCFDLCLIPAHDGRPENARTRVSRGPLNRVRTQPGQARPHHLLLIGGPSKHYRWNDADLTEQIAVLDAVGAAHWQAVLSRRTPAEFARQLAARCPAIPQILPGTVAPDWLKDQLPGCREIWVTPDSASMVYEALSSGAATGIFDLPVRHRSRVVRGIQSLVEDGLLTRWQDWRAGRKLTAPSPPFDEARRLAPWILSWLNAN
jgi:mitochondrial fission protein ELM1